MLGVELHYFHRLFKGGSRHKVLQGESYFLYKVFWSTLHRNALAAWAAWLYPYIY